MDLHFLNKSLWANKSSLGVTFFSFWCHVDHVRLSARDASGLDWKCAFVGKRRKKVWQTTPSCLFWIVWKARNRIAFKDDSLSIQNLKYLFLFLLWSETKFSIENGPMILVGFIDWMRCK